MRDFKRIVHVSPLPLSLKNRWMAVEIYCFSEFVWGWRGGGGGEESKHTHPSCTMDNVLSRGLPSVAATVAMKTCLQPGKRNRNGRINSYLVDFVGY